MRPPPAQFLQIQTPFHLTFSAYSEKQFSVSLSSVSPRFLAFECDTRMRRVVREIRIPAGRSAAQLQSPVACCRIRCTSVDVKGAPPPTSSVTFGIITVTRWFPFLSFPVYILGRSDFRGCVCLLPSASAPAVLRLQRRHVFDLLVLDVYVVRATGAFS